MRVIFLGAGASKAMGLPLTGELLPRMVEGARDGTLFAGQPDEQGRRSALLEAIARLVPGAHSRNTLPSIVDLLSLIDFALAEDFTVLPTGGAATLRSSRALLESGLLYILYVSPPSRENIGKFRELIWTPGTSVITTNYDFIPDRAALDLLKRGGTIDYGMSWRSIQDGMINHRPTTAAFRLLKLHGSSNWLGCPSCEQILRSAARAPRTIRAGRLT